MPTYYDDGEDPNAVGTDTEDFIPAGIAPFLTQGQAIARDDLLSQGLPTIMVPSAQPQFTAVRPMGEASRAFASGVPGLFVQGGPSVPAGMIEVNGQLERSQAAPQPVPWWITARDQAQDQRRQEDFLLTLLDRTKQQGQVNGSQAIDRAQQLQGRLQLQSDLRSGLPFREALAKNAANIYAGARGPMTSLAIAKEPPKPATGVRTFTDPKGRDYYEAQPGQLRPVPQMKAPSEDASVAQKLAYWSHRLTNIQKQREAAQYSRDKNATAGVDKAEAEALGEVDRLLKRGQSPAAPAAAQEQSMSLEQRQLDQAKQLRKEHPEWSTDKVKAEARKLK